MKVLTFLAKSTHAESYKSFKYCFEKSEVPTVIYDDKQKIVFSDDKNGETDKGLKKPKSLEDKVKKSCSDIEEPLFRYFLDGSRRTYKVDDLAYGKRLYPVIAGQIGVGCCVRCSSDSFKSVHLDKQLVLSLPECANKDGYDEMFFNRQVTKLNDIEFLKKYNISFQKIFGYKDKELEAGEKYEHKGIAKIQDEMVDREKCLVDKLMKEKKLNVNAYLLKDGSLQYPDMKNGDFRSLSRIKQNYQCVVGVSKSFNPELCKDHNNKSIAKEIAGLPYMSRTPAYKYSVERIPDTKFSVWYLRIREQKYTASPFDGVIKIEKILVTSKELEEGLDSDEIDRISVHLINERNPTCYGLDNRWANHLYPVFLTERFIKSQYLSDLFFLNLF